MKRTRRYHYLHLRYINKIALVSNECEPFSFAILGTVLDMTSMGSCKKDATLFLTQWVCVFLALTHQYEIVILSQSVGLYWYRRLVLDVYDRLVPWGLRNEVDTMGVCSKPNEYITLRYRNATHRELKLRFMCQHVDALNYILMKNTNLLNL